MPPAVLNRDVRHIRYPWIGILAIVQPISIRIRLDRAAALLEDFHSVGHSVAIEVCSFWIASCHRQVGIEQTHKKTGSVEQKPQEMSAPVPYSINGANSQGPFTGSSVIWMK